jgi:hypothetical protein
MHGRPGTDRRGEVGRLAIHEHVDVRSKPGSRFDQAVAHARRSRIEGVQDHVDRGAIDLMTSLDTREEREQGARQ